MSAFDIVAVAELKTADVLEVINVAFGRNESVDWFRWKHHDGPWGPSIGVAAVDDSGPIGLRLLLPWRLRRGNEIFATHRATEAATIPLARGKGVFTALNRWMMEEVSTDLIFSTPNMNSRGGYLKLDWREIARVPHRWELATTHAASPVRPPGSETAVHTDWDRASLEWRADPRSGTRYEGVSSKDAVIYYRRLRRWGLTVLAPLSAIGDPAEISALWRQALNGTGARLILRPATQVAPAHPNRWGVRRGESLILGWRPQDSALSDTRALDSVPWSAADLEGVI